MGYVFKCAKTHFLQPLGLSLSDWSTLQSVQLSHSVEFHSVTPWIAARQASLSFTASWSLLKLMSIESVMPSNHLILCRPLLLPSVFPSIRVFSSEPVLHLRRPIKKSHYLWSASWRNKKANGVTQSESQCPRTKGVTDGIPSLRLKAWKPGATNVSVKVQKSKKQGL